MDNIYNTILPYAMKRCVETNEYRTARRNDLVHKTKTISEIILKNAKRDEMYEFNNDRTIFFTIMRMMGLFAIVDAKNIPEDYSNYRCFFLHDFRLSMNDYNFEKWFDSMVNILCCCNEITGTLSICVSDTEHIDEVMRLIPNLKYILENSTLKVALNDIKDCFIE